VRRKNLIKALIVLVVIGWSIWKLIPTIQLQTLSAEEKERLRLRGKLTELEAKAIRRGLDLQGGIYLVLEVDLPQLVESLAKHKDKVFRQILEETKKEMLENPQADFLEVFAHKFKARGIPLNRYFGSPGDSESKILGFLSKEAEDAIDRSLEILRNRVDQFGVAEPNIQKRGSRRIIVELPGIQDIDRAKALIGKTALLEFKLLKDPDVVRDVLRRINEELKKIQQALIDTTAIVKKEEKPKKEPEKVEEAKKPEEEEVITIQELFGGAAPEVTEAGTTAVAEVETTGIDTALAIDQEIFKEDPFYALLRDTRPLGLGWDIGVPAKNRPVVERILKMPRIQKVIPPDAHFLWSSHKRRAGDMEYYGLFLVKKEPELTGKYLTDARAQLGGGSSFAGNTPIVTMRLNSEGRRIFKQVTGANVGKRLAIVLDDKVYMAPVIREKIPGGSAQIEGLENMEEARDLSIVLRAGALPAPVQIIEERTVGPSLGRDSIQKGYFSAALGLIIVMLFMMIYYRMSGIIADLALTLNLVIILAVLAGFGFTLTLPGVAGIILTIGMAVDANVLIFERIREELRTGKTIRAAIDAGYSRAFRTILDANVTTLIAAVVLYQFGTGPIRGFALTLSIGILSSMFTAILFTRLIFDYITEHFAIRKLSI